MLVPNLNVHYLKASGFTVITGLSESIVNYKVIIKIFIQTSTNLTSTYSPFWHVDMKVYCDSRLKRAKTTKIVI